MSGSPSADATRVTLPNGLTVWSLNRHETEHLYKEIFEEKIYLSGAQGGLSERPIIVDVGANIGLFSLFAVTELGAGRVVAFEPVPPVFDVLRQNTCDRAEIAAHRMALGDSDETVDIGYYPYYTIMSGLHADPARDSQTVRDFVVSELAASGEDFSSEDIDIMLMGRFEKVVHSCEVRTLTSLVDTHGIPRIDLLKIDVEGHEIAVLRGISPEVWPLIRTVAVEVSGDSLGQVCAILRAGGMLVDESQAVAQAGTDLRMVHAVRA